MKVWLDSNYNIVRDDGCNKFTKGNNLYDRITICLLTESVANDNTLPFFNFLLANGRKYGPFEYTKTSIEGEYTLFTYELSDNLLSVEGTLQATISINFFNNSNNVVKTKNVNIVGNVIDSVVVADDIIILGNEESIVRSLVEDIEAVANKLGDIETAVIGDVSASVNNEVGIPNVNVNVDRSNPRKPNINLAFQNLKGETGARGPQGERGPQGASGITTPVETGFFSFYVDETTGELFLLADSADTVPTFEYDEVTGNLYVLQDDEGAPIHYNNGDDLAYGN